MAMSTTNRITEVAIVGAGGNLGSFISEALLKTGKHAVTAITRADSQSVLPKGVTIKKVNYDRPETISEALRGSDVLIITISGRAQIQEVEEKLVRAAADANVPWILPNEWSPDSTHEGVIKDVPLFKAKVATRQLIGQLGKSSYIAVVTGFWYEWSLANPVAYGIDFANKSATLFDEGTTKICTSTWPQIGLAVARLLDLPVKSESSTDRTCLENFRNKVVYIKSFTVSQRDMLESAIRVTDTDESQWKITKEPATERYAGGVKQMQEGNFVGFAKMLYTRMFYADGCGDFEHSKGTCNDLLGLPNEDIDEASRVALERSKKPSFGTS